MYFTKNQAMINKKNKNRTVYLKKVGIYGDYFPCIVLFSLEITAKMMSIIMPLYHFSASKF